MTWRRTALSAVRIALRLIGAGSRADSRFCPAWFTQTAGRTVTSMHDESVKRKAGAANPKPGTDMNLTGSRS